MQLTSGGVLANTSTVNVLSGGNLQVAVGGTVTAAVPVNVASGGTLSVTAPTAQLLSSTITLQPGGILDAPFAAPGFQLGVGQTLTAGRTSSPATDIVGNMTVAGGVLSVGSGTLTACDGTGTLGLSGGSVNLNLTNTPTNLGGSNGMIDPSNLALSGNTTLDLNAVNLALGSGTYNLIDYGSLTSGGTANLTMNLIGVALGARQTFTLQTTPSALDLVVGGQVGTTKWTGTASSNWDIDTTANWKFASGSGTTQFFNDDIVTFDDTAHTGNVTVTTTVSPGSMTFSNTALTYTLAGTGDISGDGGLTVNGAGTVILANSNGNDYTGATAVNSGVLVLGSANAVHNSSVTLNGGSLHFLPSIGTFDIGGLTSASALSLSDTGGGAVVLSLGAGGANSSLTGPISGIGGLTQAGTGTLTLGGNNTSYSGTTSVTAGSILLANSNAVAGSTVAVSASNGIAFQSGIGTFNMGGLTGEGGMSLLDTAGAGVNLSVGGNNQSTQFTGGLSGSGSLVKVGNSELSLAGSGIAYTGNTTVSTGTLQLYNASNFSNGTNPANTINIAGGAVLEMYVDTSGSAGNGNNQILGTTGTTTISGAGTFRKTGNGQLGASGADVGTLNIAMSPGGLIDLQGGTFQNGGWQAVKWTSNQASLNIGAGGQPRPLGRQSRSGQRPDRQRHGHQRLHRQFQFDHQRRRGQRLVNVCRHHPEPVRHGHAAEVRHGPAGPHRLQYLHGATVVNGGTLQIGNGGSGEAIANTGIVGVAAGATLVFKHSDSTSVAGPGQRRGQFCQARNGHADRRGPGEQRKRPRLRRHAGHGRVESAHECQSLPGRHRRRQFVTHRQHAGHQWKRQRRHLRRQTGGPVHLRYRSHGRTFRRGGPYHRHVGRRYYQRQGRHPGPQQHEHQCRGLRGRNHGR